MKHAMRHPSRILPILVLIFLAFRPGPPLSAQTEIGAGSVVTGPSGVESRNSSIRIGEGAIIEGPVRSRNGRVEVEGDVEVGAGVETTNGRIELGARTVVQGSVATRNGRIALGDGVRVHGSVESRNGRIGLGANGRIHGHLETRNGSVNLGPGARVDGNAGTRNGAVRLEDAQVRGDVDVYTGDVELTGASDIHGDLVVLMPRDRGGVLPSWLPFVGSPSEPVIRIGEDARVRGRLVVDERARLEVAPGADVPDPERFPHRDAWSG